MQLFVESLDESFRDENGEWEANCCASKDEGEGEDPVEREEPVRIQLRDETVAESPHQQDEGEAL